MRPWLGGNSKPPLGAQINWGHPLAPSECYVPRPGGVISPLAHSNPLTVVSPAVSDDNGLTLNSAGAYAAGSLHPNMKYQWPLSIVMACTYLGGTITYGTQMAGAEPNNTNSNPYYCYNFTQRNGTHAYFAPAIWFQYVGGYGVVQSSAIDRNFRTGVVVGTMQDGYQALYLNGSLLNTGTYAVGTITYAATARMIFGSTGATNTNILLHSWSVYPRALTASEVAWLYAEPWCFMSVPGPQVSYFIMPSAGTAAAMHYYTQVRV